MPIFATAGSKLYIGTAIDQKSTDFVAADFTSQAWVEVKELDTLGTLGDTSQAITQSIIGEGRDKTLKGTRNAGTMEVVTAIDYADAGQLAVIAAEKTPYDYAFKIVLNDAPATGSDPTPSQRLFIAKVMSAAEALDQANNVMKMNISLAINSNIVRVAATAGA
ncbi:MULTISPECIES: hypothetical protein [unclassified Rhizobium]|uniref:hypothetical protein n=1 Tax=unclassified Rhizobium TaxID=2613769 RepID=UPI001615DB66|nr:MULTISPECIES: hypothetical protein [unclassified Rhizobium]MBB3289904.1 hypothetical protein [Rhizobium sp. BK252]MBB3404133.1 hypothetical protein [Rhizobium sp. BK289]MBB3417232.1 hypothetical protein [Rhizobium sp. BK284]MBB3485109.1 hypothetical protein [Rhizobium sp. BK347]